MPWATAHTVSLEGAIGRQQTERRTRPLFSHHVAELRVEILQRTCVADANAIRWIHDNKPWRLRGGERGN